MKTLITILFFASLTATAQPKKPEITFVSSLLADKLQKIHQMEKLSNEDAYDLMLGEIQLASLLPAQASITITITDNGSYTLADIRDNLCQLWGYTGNQNDNAAKLAFLKQYLINKIVNDYVLAKQNSTSISISSQLNIN